MTLKEEINQLKKELREKEKLLKESKIIYEKIKDNPYAVWHFSATAVVLLPNRIKELKYRIWEKESIYEMIGEKSGKNNE